VLPRLTKRQTNRPNGIYEPRQQQYHPAVCFHFGRHERGAMFQAQQQREGFYEAGRNDCGAGYGGIRVDPSKRQRRIL